MGAGRNPAHAAKVDNIAAAPVNGAALNGVRRLRTIDHERREVVQGAHGQLHGIREVEPLKALERTPEDASEHDAGQRDGGDAERRDCRGTQRGGILTT